MGMRTRALRTGAAVMIALSLSAPLAAQGTQRSAIAIGNFGQINDQYYRGEQPEGRDYADLARLGVKMVIDLQRGGDPREQGLVEAAGMKFTRIELTTTDTPAAGDVEKFLKLVNDPVNQPVYVHCAGGKHRTGVMTAAYRMTHDSWTADQAYAEMKKYKFETLLPHPELKSFVYDFFQARTAAAAGAGK